MYRSTLS